MSVKRKAIPLRSKVRPESTQIRRHCFLRIRVRTPNSRRSEKVGSNSIRTGKRNRSAHVERREIHGEKAKRKSEKNKCSISAN